MNNRFAILGTDIFDGTALLKNHAALVEDERIVDICDISSLPESCETQEVSGGLIAPGFIDLQVNGGGGVLLNDQLDVDAIATICSAHRAFGTTALLPTLITDTPETTTKAIHAGIEAAEKQVPGFLGLHLEGPHLDPNKNGAHRTEFIRPMEENDLNQLIEARKQLPNLMITVAPSSVTNEQIMALSNAGIIVSLGHSAASFKTAQEAAKAGASCVTHLYNAMSPLTHREPGMVGAALQSPELYAGLIADGFHVDPAAISIALAAKTGPGRIFLVTDAMSTIGTDQQSFELNGRIINRDSGRLLLEDGTLAGADLDMITAVRYMNETVGLELLEAIRMASLYPAQCLGVENSHGTLQKGKRADLIHINNETQVTKTWIGGKSDAH